MHTCVHTKYYTFQRHAFLPPTLITGNKIPWSWYEKWIKVHSGQTDSLGTAAYCTSCSSEVILSPLVLQPTLPTVAVRWDWSHGNVTSIPAFDKKRAWITGRTIHVGAKFQSSQKNLPQCLFLHQQFHMDYLELNPCLQGKKLPANCTWYGTAYWGITNWIM